ncbi:MAG: LSM domain-containing protein [Candidatus Hodarchaeales archaeon]|jgi:small nuclear ribonucleoprotein
MDFPIKALQKARGKMVVVRLKSGIEYKGRLDQSDEHMNLLLMDVEETTEDKSRRLGKAFVRGNNLLFVKI